MLQSNFAMCACTYLIGQPSVLSDDVVLHCASSWARFNILLHNISPFFFFCFFGSTSALGPPLCPHTGLIDKMRGLCFLMQCKCWCKHDPNHLWFVWRSCIPIAWGQTEHILGTVRKKELDFSCCWIHISGHNNLKAFCFFGVNATT